MSSIRSKILTLLAFVLTAVLPCLEAHAAETTATVATLRSSDGASSIDFDCTLRENFDLVGGKAGEKYRQCTYFFFQKIEIHSQSGGHWIIQIPAERSDGRELVDLDERADAELRIRLGIDLKMFPQHNPYATFATTGPFGAILDLERKNHFPLGDFSPRIFLLDEKTVQTMIDTFLSASSPKVLETLAQPSAAAVGKTVPLLMVLGSGIRDRESGTELKIGCVKSFDDINQPCRDIVAVEDTGDGISRSLGNPIEPTELTPKAIMDAFARSVSKQSVRSTETLVKTLVSNTQSLEFTPPVLSFPEKFDSSTLIDASILAALQRKDTRSWQLHAKDVDADEYRRIRTIFSGGTGNSLTRTKDCTLSSVFYMTDGYNIFEDNQNVGLLLKNTDYSLGDLAIQSKSVSAVQADAINKTVRQGVEKLLVESRVGSFVDIDPSATDSPQLIFKTENPLLCGTVYHQNGLSISGAPYRPCGGSFRLVLKKNPHQMTKIDPTGEAADHGGTPEQPELELNVFYKKDKRRMWPTIQKWLQQQLGCHSGSTSS